MTRLLPDRASTSSNSNFIVVMFFKLTDIIVYIGVLFFRQFLPFFCCNCVLTALHGMQTRSCDEISVCLSVRPSVCQTRALWQNGRKISAEFYTIWKIIQCSFMRGRKPKNGCCEATPSIWNCGSTGPRWSEIVVAPQPYDLAKKIQLALIGSPLRAFQRA